MSDLCQYCNRKIFDNHFCVDLVETNAFFQDDTTDESITPIVIRRTCINNSD